VQTQSKQKRLQSASKKAENIEDPASLNDLLADATGMEKLQLEHLEKQLAAMKQPCPLPKTPAAKKAPNMPDSAAQKAQTPGTSTRCNFCRSRKIGGCGGTNAHAKCQKNDKNPRHSLEF